MAGSRLPIVIATSVVRSSTRKSEHGAVYVVDLESRKHKKVVSSDSDIGLGGRGKERGYRGVAFYNNLTYVALYNKILIYDHDFNEVASISEPDFMLHIHEIFIFGDNLYITSTGFDSILVVDLKKNEFLYGYHYFKGNVQKFDKTSSFRPKINDSMHINNVYVDHRGIFLCGTNINNLLLHSGNSVSRYGSVPAGTHNCRPYGPHILCNNTENNSICIVDKQGRILKSCNVKNLNMKAHVNERVARQPFARGLAIGDDVFIGGSSPEMLSVYDKATLQNKKNIILTKNIRCSIHGLEIYPYSIKL